MLPPGENWSRVCRSSVLLLWENGLPIVLHADHRPTFMFGLGHERVAQTCGTGSGPKNIRSTFSFPITRTSSCIVQYMTISTSRMIWIAQKWGHDFRQQLLITGDKA